MPALRRLLVPLALAVTVSALAGVASSFPLAGGCAPAAAWGMNRADLARQVVDLVNEHRAAKGLGRLAVSAPLTASAEWKSLHMAGAGYFAHDDPAPFSRSALERTRDCGYRGGAWAENIAYGYPSPRAVLSGWIASPGHRANLERPGHTAIGVGVASRSGRLYWTQTFGNDASGAAPARASAIGARPARVTRAGSTLTVRVPFVEVNSGRPVAGGTVACRAAAGSRTLPVLTRGFAGGVARCAWRVPAGLAGRELVGVVKLRVGTAVGSRTFIRPAG
jgi:uncharacterized protein YkwD